MDLIENNGLNINRHPWEIARAASVLRILRKKSLNTQYADIGAGDLFFTQKLARHTNNSIYAVDINYTAERKIEGIIQCREIAAVSSNSIDCIILMDVLEHIEEEDAFLESLKGILKDGGEIVITVPAYSFLFSSHDRFLKHSRRYNIRRLSGLLSKHDLIIKETFYFFIVLFFIRCLQVILLKLGFPLNMNAGAGNWKLKESNVVTFLITGILIIDFSINRFLRRLGIILPGLSLCLICQKKSV